jgi:hypothetical protein
MAHGRLFQPSLMFVGKVRSLQKSGTPERLAPVLLLNIRVALKGLPRTYSLAYWAYSEITKSMKRCE